MEAILHTRRVAGNKTNVFCESQYYNHFMPGYLSLDKETLPGKLRMKLSKVMLQLQLFLVLTVNYSNH